MIVAAHRPLWRGGRSESPPADASLGSERGSSPIEELLVLPTLMLLVLAALQFGLYGLAAHASSLALSEGAAEVRAAGGGLAAGERLVRRDLAAIAPHLLVSPRLWLERSAGQPSTLVLSGTVPSVLFGIHLRVRVASAGFTQGFKAG